jgi:hypothetical protein
MAVEAIAFGGTADENATTVFLSEYIRRPIRLLAIQVSWDGSTADDTFSVFSTLSPEPVEQPQPGDPPILRAMNIPTRVTSAFSIAIPVPTRSRLMPPMRFALVFKNTDATNARKVTATIWYDTEE